MKSDETVRPKIGHPDSLGKGAGSGSVWRSNYVTVGGLPENAQDGWSCAGPHGNVRAAHWSQQPSIVTQFWQRVRKTRRCWLWTGAVNRHRGGYGIISLGALRTRTSLHWYAHRFSYELHFGRIPDGMQVCHHCDNPPCVNPDHLFLGTPGDNVRDASRKGRLHVARPTRRKVSDADIRTFHELRAQGWLLDAIADRFDVTRSFVGLVLRGQRRAEVLPIKRALQSLPSHPEQSDRRFDIAHQASEV